MIKKLILAMLFLFIVVYFMLQHYYGDVQINKYTDKASVLEQNATEHGWIPALLPDSAYEIAETHDIDTNEVFGAFYYKEQDEEALMQKLAPMPDMNETYIWETFLFKVDRENNKVKFRNKPKLQ